MVGWDNGDALLASPRTTGSSGTQRPALVNHDRLRPAPPESESDQRARLRSLWQAQATQPRSGLGPRKSVAISSTVTQVTLSCSEM